LGFCRLKSHRLGLAPSTTPLSGSLPVLFPDCISDFNPDIVPETHRAMLRDSLSISNPGFWQESLGNTIPEMFGDIPQAIFPAIVPGSIVGCKGATDPDCIPESIPETMPVFNKRNHWQWRLQIAIRQSVFTTTWPRLDNMP